MRPKSEESPQRDGHSWYLVTLVFKKAGITAGPLLSGRLVTGKFTKNNTALHLGKSTGRYRRLISSKAAIFARLWTSKSFPKVHLHSINTSEMADCDCGLIESILHFLFSCRRWVQQRATLRQLHGDRFGDLSYTLGEYSSRRGGKNVDRPLKHWKPDINVVKATIPFTGDTGRLHPSKQDTVNTEADRNENEDSPPHLLTEHIMSHLYTCLR